jgi:hypothetical protein
MTSLDITVNCKCPPGYRSPCGPAMPKVIGVPLGITPSVNVVSGFHSVFIARKVLFNNLFSPRNPNPQWSTLSKFMVPNL